MVLVKAGNHGFYQYRSWLILFSLSGSNTAEAGYPGIPRSINMGIRVRLCSDWCLRRRTASPTIRKQLSASSSEHNTHILHSGMPGLPASDL
ncbi:MAG: hypothetical protein ACLSE4_13155 [Clostridium sp.]